MNGCRGARAIRRYLGLCIITFIFASAAGSALVYHQVLRTGNRLESEPDIPTATAPRCAVADTKSIAESPSKDITHTPSLKVRSDEHPVVSSDGKTSMQDSTPEIVTHDVVLRAERQNDGGPGMVINLISPQYGAHAQVTRPLAVEVVDESERSGWINGDYSGVVRQDNCLICTGDLGIIIWNSFCN